MTIKNLIAKLQKLPQETAVFLLGDNDLVTGAADVELVSELDDYPCVGYSDDVAGDEFHAPAVVISYRSKS